jgi:hypothetical protein
MFHSVITAIFSVSLWNILIKIAMKWEVQNKNELRNCCRTLIAVRRVKFKHIEVESICSSDQGNKKYQRGLDEEFPKEIHDLQA